MIARPPLPDYMSNYPDWWRYDGTATSLHNVLGDLLDPDRYPELDTRAAANCLVDCIATRLLEAEPTVARQTAVLVEHLAEVIKIEQPQLGLFVGYGVRQYKMRNTKQDTDTGHNN
jgi:hypothetical protein